MRNQDNKVITTVVVILFVLIILGGLGYFACDKLLKKPIEEDKSSAVTDQKNVESINDDDALKTMEYQIVNPKKMGYSDDDQWILIKYDFDQANETGKTPLDNRISNVDDDLASQMIGYQYGFINGYYNNSVFYTSVISDKKLIIKKIDFAIDNKSYDEFINISMPDGYELCGLWEGSRKNTDCEATILYMSNDNMYIHTVGEKFTNDIYLLNTTKKSLTKLKSSYRNGTHSKVVIHKYNDYLILTEDDGIFVTTNLSNGFDAIHEKEQNSGEQVKLVKIVDNELYFSTDKTEYDSEQSPKERIETHIDYKYNFGTKETVEINRTTNKHSY